MPGRRPPGAPTRRGLALSVLCISLLIVSLDNTVLNVALPTLVKDLHATSTQLQWIVDAYVIVFAGLLLVAGSVADRVGRKRTFLVGLVAFAAGSTWAAFSGSVAHLIAARASMGIGGALIMPSTLAIITNMFTEERERARAFGLWAGTSGVGIALGPIVGGLLLAHFWWGSVFLVNVPIAGLGLLLSLTLVPDSKNPAAQRSDLVGAFLSMVGMGLLLWSIIEAPVRGWASGRVIGAGAGGLGALAGFALWESVSSHPMLRVEFFRDRRFSAAIVSVGLAMFGLFGALFVLTQFMQFQLGYSALGAGIRVLPAAGAIAVVAPLSSLLARAVGTKPTVVAGLVVVSGGLFQISRAAVGTTFTGTVAGMVLLGVGAGLVIPSATSLVMGSLPLEHTGVGSATNGSFLQVGGALGVGVIGSLLSDRYQHRLSPALSGSHVPHQVEHAILGSLGGALEVARSVGGSAGELLSHAARAAFVSGMDLGLVAGAGVALAGALLATLTLPGRGAGAGGPAAGRAHRRHRHRRRVVRAHAARAGRRAAP